MRRFPVSLIAALTLVVTTMLFSAPAAAAEYTFTATVGEVLVNRAGGITISGTLDCTNMVEDIYGAGQIPENTTVFVNVNWEAYQLVGKSNTVYARYDSGIASLCFNNDADFPGAPQTTGPWPWQTLYAYPVGGTQWVYSTSGKFTPGRIHIELNVVGYFSVGTDEHLLVNLTPWDLRAVKVR